MQPALFYSVRVNIVKIIGDIKDGYGYKLRGFEATVTHIHNLCTRSCRECTGLLETKIKKNVIVFKFSANNFISLSFLDFLEHFYLVIVIRSLFERLAMGEK